MSPIFVFGSNLAGRHGKGAALDARRQYGAEYGVGRGRTGNAYAIPTKSATLAILPVDQIAQYVGQFVDYATSHPEFSFLVTRVGCGLAGYADADIGPLFAASPSNCLLPETWECFRADQLMESERSSLMP